MRRAPLILALFLFSSITVSAQSVDEIITNPNGDIYVWHMDTDYYVPIKVDVKRLVRGEEREYETVLGDYKEVAGWFMPFSIETNVKGRPEKSKIVFETIQANVEIDDARFKKPTTVPSKN